MRNSISLISALLLGLLSCGGEEATSAANVAFTDASSAVDAAAVAFNSEDYASAVKGYQYAFDNSPSETYKAKFACDLFKAQVKNNDNAAANGTLGLMSKDLKAQLNSELLSGLAKWCLKEMDATMAQSVLELADNNLSEVELAKFNPDLLGESIEKVRSGDTKSLKDLGYVDAD